MHYVISFLLGILIFGLLIINKQYFKKTNIIKIISIVGVFVLLARMFSYEPIIYNKSDDFWGLDSSPLKNNRLTGFSLILIWMSFSSILFVLMRPFYNLKFVNNIVKYIVVPFYIIQPFFLEPMCTILQGVTDSKMLIYLYSVENAIGLGISSYYLFNSILEKEKVNYQDILKMFLAFILLSIFTMPNYFPQYFFGFKLETNGWVIKKFTQYHRLMIYGNIIIPFAIYFFLQKKDEDFKRFNLLYICLGVLLGFIVKYYYDSLKTPWEWPFHLCNTALFILPLVLAFRMKKFFYFTYFINVIGALLAMLIPNYLNSTNIMSVRLVGFWYNHYIAFFMPMLFVFLDMFERPKIKQFIYSMSAFAGYFLFVLILNVVFTEAGHEVDYFFLNGDFIVDKLGLWAEELFEITFEVKVANNTYIFRPVYQVLFFFVYVLLGLAVWFIYEEMYRIFDDNILLHLRLRKLRKYERELKEALQGRKKEEPMEKDAGIKYELKNFSKQYGSSKRFAVKEANFAVYGGEIFGFLGPNGAGKSTIIKSTVGIQPITSGNINICGYDVATQSVHAKSLIGFVPDHYALYEKLTGREYVNYIADIYGVSIEDRNERIEKYIKLFELENSIDNMIKTYSHGMKQKITIMAALVHDPKVWILDEPLTGLDPNSIYQVKECMKEHASKGNIVFFSSHIIDIVEKLCQRVAIIKQGEIQCVKTVQEIEDSGYTLEQFYLKTIGNEIEGISPTETPKPKTRGRRRKKTVDQTDVKES